MPDFIVMCGIPGSGKSTLVEKMAETEKARVVNPDSIRQALTGDATDQTQNAKVWMIAYDWVRAYLKAGESVILDATSTTTKERKKAVETAREFDAKLYACVVDTPHELCLTRNRNRDRVVPEEIMQKFIDRFRANCSTEQLQAEGFIVCRPAIIR